MAVGFKKWRLRVDRRQLQSEVVRETIWKSIKSEHAVAVRHFAVRCIDVTVELDPIEVSESRIAKEKMK